MPTRHSRVFFTVFSALLAAGLAAMGLHAALRAGELAERQTARLSQDLRDSYQECRTMTTAAVRTAVTFHTEALVLALDEQGGVLARTQEFLLLRDVSNRNTPYLALLPGLTGAQRSALRALASRPDGSYPYGSVVYPDPRSKHPDSQACGQPLRLLLQSTGRDGECDLLLATLDDNGEAWSEWLPYLAACAGAKPPMRVPKWLARLLAGEVAVTMMTEGRGFSNAKAKRELGWKLRYPSWRQGFKAELA